MSIVKNTQLVGDKIIIKLAVWSLEKGMWQPVQKAGRHRRKIEEWGTYQLIEAGDIVLMSTINTETDEVITCVQKVYSVSESCTDHTLDKVTFVDIGSTIDIGPIFRGVSEALWDWLRDTSKDLNSILPPGVGWDGKFTLYDKYKRDRIRGLMYGVQDDEFMKTVLDAGQISSGFYTPTEWNKAGALSALPEGRVSFDLDANSMMAFSISWTTDGNCELQTKDIEDHTQPLTYTPSDDVVRLIAGVVNKAADGESPIIRWSLYAQ